MVRPLLTLVVLTALVAPGVRAGEVEVRVESDEAFVDIPFALAIDVAQTEGHEAPVFPELENADVELADSGLSQSSSSFSITINGRQVRQTQSMRYLYRITPRQPGLLRVPAIPVSVDGETKYTRPLLLRVSRADASNLLFVELKASKPEVYVGEPIELTLEIWLLPFADRGVRFGPNEMWDRVDRAGSSWGPFAELLERGQARVTYRGDKRVGDDQQMRSYIVYEVTQRVWAERPGPLMKDDVRIVVSYPLRVGRDDSPFSIFNGPRVTQARPVVGTITESPVTVKAIPTEGRPLYYRGAVGRHTIQAMANPVEVSVGDPITLTMMVRGEGRLETLQAPPLADLPEFTSRFQVAVDPLPGVVQDGAKRFTQSLRPLNSEVTEIPSIPLAYFDTDRGEFVTVYSEPIPLQIAAAERMSATQIVQSEGSGERTTDVLTRSVYGIEGNYTNAAELLAQQGLRASPALAAVAGGCPLVYAVCALLQRRRDRLISDTALRRRRGARRAAMKRLDEAKGDPGLLAEALLSYVSDRFDRPAGGLTRQEAVQQLGQAGMSAEVVRRVDEVLSDCEAARFAGRMSTAAAELEGRVRAALAALVRADG